MHGWLNNLFEEGNLRLEEAEVVLSDNITIWHSSVLDHDAKPLSAGFGENQKFARKVAIAELLERRFFLEVNKDLASKTKWGLNLISTGCGFAAGFDLENTIQRSIHEAVERWVMSKWIDDHLKMDEVFPEMDSLQLNPASRFFIQQFDTVRFFQKEIILKNENSFYKIRVVVTLGFLGNGIYPGSTTERPETSLWEHALLESFRHLLVIRNNKNINDIYPQNKVLFFSKNSNIAVSQISNAVKTNWPTPAVSFHLHESFMNGKYFIARTILAGWKSWNEGAIERFLY